MRRLLALIPTLWAVATLTFLALYLVPGDAAQMLLAESYATEEEIADRRAELGLDDGILIQYGRYLTRLLQGDLGRSFFSGRPVRLTIGEQLPSTLSLAGGALIIQVVVGLGLGVLSAAREGTWLDSVITSLASIGIAAPVFWSSLLAIWLFALVLDLLPATGQGGLEYLVLPASVLGLSSAGAVARVSRASVVEIGRQPYILVARSKGLKPPSVMLGHTLRVALLPALTVIGLQFGFLLGGAVVTETVFARQGLGRLLVEAILHKDMPVVLGVVLVGVVGYVLVNLITDILSTMLDPRLRGRSSPG